MRIAFPTSEFVSEDKNFSGGLANYLYRLSLYLKNIGHEPIIIVSAEKNEKINYNAIDVYRVKLFPKYWYRIINRLTFNKLAPVMFEILQSWWLNQKIQELHNEKPFDIIQYPSYMSVGFFRIKSIPHALRISSIIKLWHKADNRNCNSIKLKQIHWLENYTFRKQKYIFGPSNALNKEAEKIARQKTETIETPFFKETTISDYTVSEQIQNIVQGKPYFLYFGSLNIYKGLLEIAEILSLLFEKLPDFYFVFAGTAASIQGISMVDYLKQKAGRFENRIIYLGNFRHELLYPVIEQAYAIVLPSRVDNFPNTLIEAMSHGKIVIGSKTAGFDQLISDGENGFLFENENAKELLNKLILTSNLSFDEKKKIEYFAAKTIERLKPEIVVSQLIIYYQKVIRSF